MVLLTSLLGGNLQYVKAMDPGITDDEGFTGAVVKRVAWPALRYGATFAAGAATTQLLRGNDGPATQGCVDGKCASAQRAKTLDGQLEGLQKKLTAAREKAEKDREAISEKASKIAELRAQLTALESRSGAADATVGLQAEITKLTSKLTSMTEDRNGLKRELERIRAEVVQQGGAAGEGAGNQPQLVLNQLQTTLERTQERLRKVEEDYTLVSTALLGYPHHPEGNRIYTWPEFEAELKKQAEAFEKEISQDLEAARHEIADQKHKLRESQRQLQARQADLFTLKEEKDRVVADLQKAKETYDSGLAAIKEEGEGAKTAFIEEQQKREGALEDRIAELEAEQILLTRFAAVMMLDKKARHQLRTAISGSATKRGKLEKSEDELNEGDLGNLSVHNMGSHVRLLSRLSKVSTALFKLDEAESNGKVMRAESEVESGGEEDEERREFQYQFDGGRPDVRPEDDEEQ